MCSSHVLLNEYGQSNGQQTDMVLAWYPDQENIYVHTNVWNGTPYLCFNFTNLFTHRV